MATDADSLRGMVAAGLPAVGVPAAGAEDGEGGGRCAPAGAAAAGGAAALQAWRLRGRHIAVRRALQKPQGAARRRTPCRGFSDGPSDGPTDGPSDGAALSLLMGLLSDGTEDKARLLQPDGASPLEIRRQPNV